MYYPKRGHYNDYGARYYDTYDDRDYDEDEEDEDEDEFPDFRIYEEDLPERLWRVCCPDSATPYSASTGFGSRDHKALYIRDPDQFIPAIKHHLNWKSNRRSPFISTFERRSHAEAWARSWLQKHPEFENPGLDSIEVMEIDPRKIMNEKGNLMPIISVEEVVMLLPEERLLPRGIKERQIRDEYLCLYYIPKQAIVRVHHIEREEEDLEMEEFYDSLDNDGYSLFSSRRSQSKYQGDGWRRPRPEPNRRQNNWQREPQRTEFYGYRRNNFSHRQSRWY